MKETIIKAVVSVVLTAVLGFIIAKVKEIAKKQKATDDGLQSLLRAEIIRTYEKSIDRGYAPIYAKQSLEICYLAYHNLGGNGCVTDLFNKTMELPTKSSKEAKND